MFTSFRNKQNRNSTCVLVTVPTNDAGDSLFEAISDFNKAAGLSPTIIRVYTQTHEVRAFTKGGPKSRDQDVGQDFAHATLIQAIAELCAGYLSRSHSALVYRTSTTLSHLLFFIVSGADSRVRLGRSTGRGAIISIMESDDELPQSASEASDGLGLGLHSR